MIKLLLPWTDVSNTHSFLQTINTRFVIVDIFYENISYMPPHNSISYWKCDFNNLSYNIRNTNNVLSYRQLQLNKYQNLNLAKKAVEELLIQDGYKILTDKYLIML